MLSLKFSCNQILKAIFIIYFIMPQNNMHGVPIMFFLLLLISKYVQQSK